MTVSLPAAGVTAFSAEISYHVGNGRDGNATGLPASTVLATGCGLDNVCTQAESPFSYSSSSFSLSPGVFATAAFEPIGTDAGGTVPLPPTPYTVYLIGSVINQSSQAGTISSTVAPGTSRAPWRGCASSVDCNTWAQSAFASNSVATAPDR